MSRKPLSRRRRASARAADTIRRADTTIAYPTVIRGERFVRRRLEADGAPLARQVKDRS